MTKRIDAIVRIEKLNDVKDALRRIGIVGMTVTEVGGRGRQGGVRLAGRNGNSSADLLPRLMLSIVLSDHNVEKTVEAIRTSAATGKIGDGLIFIHPVEDVIRIRNGERGREALHYPGDIDEQREKSGEMIGAKPGAEVVMDDILAFSE